LAICQLLWLENLSIELKVQKCFLYGRLGGFSLTVHICVFDGILKHVKYTRMRVYLTCFAVCAGWLTHHMQYPVSESFEIPYTVCVSFKNFNFVTCSFLERKSQDVLIFKLRS
jgi:hypothetical protein